MIFSWSPNTTPPKVFRLYQTASDNLLAYLTGPTWIWARTIVKAHLDWLECCIHGQDARGTLAVQLEALRFEPTSTCNF